MNRVITSYNYLEWYDMMNDKEKATYIRNLFNYIAEYRFRRDDYEKVGEFRLAEFYRTEIREMIKELEQLGAL